MRAEPPFPFIEIFFFSFFGHPMQTHPLTGFRAAP
jgi:hypothetical protein